MPLDTSKINLQNIGNYDVITKIAEGGMGAVYKAKHRDTGDIVAIKVLPPNTARNPVLLKRFEQEFRAASQIDHPNVVKAIEYCGNGPTPFLVMEYVEGQSLGQFIQNNGPMAEEQAIRIIAQVCQGLHRAHKQKLIHRDVKPDNIMVTTEGVAKLMDMGLVKDADNELNLTRTGRGLGTPHFMAPEQFRNAKNADVRCDIYSIGATLYMVLTGEVPFGKVGPLDCWMKKIRNDFTPPRELNPAISERVDWAIRRAMSADPEQRPMTCREFIEDLTGVSIRSPSILTDVAGQSADVWYLVYKDEDGETHTVKGTTEGIRRALKEQLLGDATNVRACRSKTGPFQPLRNYPEYRDLVVEPAPMPQTVPNSGIQSSVKSRTPPASGKLKPPTSASRRPVPPTDSGAVDLNTLPNSGKSPASTLPPDQPTVLEQQSLPPLFPKTPAVTEQRSGSNWFLWIGIIGLGFLTTVVAYILLHRFGV